MKRFVAKIFGIYSWLPDGELLKKYRAVGVELGNMIFDRHLGMDVSYPNVLEILISLEHEIIGRGFRTIPIQVFTYCKEEEILFPRIEEGERPVYFASLWKKTTDNSSLFGNFLARAFVSNGPLIEKASDEDIFAIESRVLQEGPKGAS